MSTNVRIVIAEGIGTCLLVFLAVGTAVIAVSAKVGVVGASPGTTVIAGALAAGLLILGLLVAIGPLSASQMSPGVTLALARRRAIPAEAAADAWTGQAIGALVAAFGLYLFVPGVTAIDPHPAPACLPQGPMP